MKKMMNNIKKVICFLLVFTLVFNVNSIVYADNDVNVDTGGKRAEGTDAGNGEGLSDPVMWDSSTGARVSLWDTETQTLIDRKNLMTFSSDEEYEKFASYKVLSFYTKPEIIALEHGLTDDMITQIKGSFTSDLVDRLGDNLCSESIKFPNLLMERAITPETRQKQIKEFYGKEENTTTLLKALKASEEDIQKWKEGKVCILIEPLIGFYTFFQTDLEYWSLTCAELGLLAYSGYCDMNHSYAKFPQVGTFNGIGFLVLPYGTFKEHDGWIKAIKAYTGPKTDLIRITNTDGYLEMINTLGCLEIINENIATPSEAVPVATASEILIKFHSNLEQLGGTGGIDEQYNLIGTVNSSDYKKLNGTKATKIPKTYSDDEAKAC